MCAGGISPGNTNGRRPVYDPLDPNRTVGNTCIFDMDCGPGSKCLKSSESIWGVIRSILHEKYSFGIIKAIAGRAGLDMTQMSHLDQTSGKSSASKSQVLSAIDAQVACMEEHRFIQFLRIVTEEMLRRQPLVEPDLLESLERLGWTVHEGHLVEVTVLD